MSDQTADLYEALAGALREAGEAEASAYRDRVPGQPMSGSWGERIYDALVRNGITVALAPTTGHGASAVATRDEELRVAVQLAMPEVHDNDHREVADLYRAVRAAVLALLEEHR